MTDKEKIVDGKGRLRSGKGRWKELDGVQEVQKRSEIRIEGRE